MRIEMVTPEHVLVHAEPNEAIRVGDLPQGVQKITVSVVVAAGQQPNVSLVYEKA